MLGFRDISTPGTSHELARLESGQVAQWPTLETNELTWLECSQVSHVVAAVHNDHAAMIAHNQMIVKFKERQARVP